jgi:hypothetical protein
MTVADFERRQQIRSLIQECACEPLTLQFLHDGQRMYLQVSDGKWTGRKWMLSPHMTDGEVVQTVLAAVLAWYEHEAREAFKFRGQAIFNPHLSLEALCKRAGDTETRKETNAQASPTTDAG